MSSLPYGERIFAFNYLAKAVVFLSKAGNIKLTLFIDYTKL